MEPWEEAMKRNAEPTAAWARRWNIAAGGRRDRADPTTTYTGYAGWVRAGWIPILDRLAEDLIALGWDRTLDQVNKKFGGLRFFIGTGSPPLGRDVRDRIARRTAWAEAESLRTCEECGAPGRSTQPGGEGGRRRDSLPPVLRGPRRRGAGAARRGGAGTGRAGRRDARRGGGTREERSGVPGVPRGIRLEPRRCLAAAGGAPRDHPDAGGDARDAFRPRHAGERRSRV
jgi:hypothetical protein